MNFSEHTKQWYYTIKAMNDVIETRQKYAYFLTTNYRDIKEGKYKWKKGFEPRDEKALLRLMNADLMSHTIRNIESLITLARVGILANKKGISHEKMRKWYFSISMKEIQDTIDYLKNNSSFEIWKWVLWISDIEETTNKMNLSSSEIKIATKLYDNMLERAQFVFFYAAEFWHLFKSVRNAFSHTFRFVPFPKTSLKVPEGYDDVILVLGKNWHDKHPIEMAILSGRYPMLEMTNLIAAFNLFEKIIFENHIRSIQIDSDRVFPNRIIADIDEKTFSKYMTILQRTPKLKEINVEFQFEQSFDEIKKQDDIYKNFRKILSQFGRKITYNDVREPFQPIKKGTKRLKS